MKRNYETGVSDDVQFFTGIEVEHTPAHGMETLFVTGLHPVEEIKKRLGTIRHIFFGANHSFSPGINFPSDAGNWERFEEMMIPFLDEDYLVTLDVPIDHAEALLESAMVERHNFIPQLRVPIPYIKQFGYNTMLKIDDKDVNATNPGVWCHRLHDLLDSEKFTDWTKYSLDKPL